MERSSSRPGTAAPVRSTEGAGGIEVVKWLDRAALAGIALGFILVFQPWGGTLRAGFFVTAFFTILHIVTSHLNVPEAE